MMQKGTSEPWPDILRSLTDGRQDQLDPSSILEYFKPLTEWLKKQNLTNTEWECDSHIDEQNSRVKSYSGQWSNSAASFKNEPNFICFKILLIIIIILTL